MLHPFASSVSFPLIVLAVLVRPFAALAVDIPVTARSLTIKDATASGGASKTTFSVRDVGAGISKGVGDDLDQVSVSFRINWSTSNGAFLVPAGARASGAPSGWIKNDEGSAKFVNKTAALGTPTGVSSLSVTNGKGLKLSARTAGDNPINLLGASFPTFGIQTALTITNYGEVLRYCTLFPADEITLRSVGGGSRKLTAKHGIAYPCAPEPMQLSPLPSLPALPSGPSLWFDGSNPAAVAAVIARTTNPETSGVYGSIRSIVDGALATLGSASDDTRALVAKGAGLLHVVGALPPGGSGYASYRDVVVTALSGIGARSAADTYVEFLSPPPNVLDVLRDAGRLQSMAEAYDLIRGSGVAPIDDAALRTRIANWADEYLLDWNLVGDPSGAFAGHLDNWAIKAGSAVTTVALALPDHPHAAAWLAQGVAWINNSLAIVARDPGWYSESPHYLNYTLNNLVSTAWHLRHAAAIDWFDDLEPFVDFALAIRQPNGQQPPFEEGVTNTFPWDVLAAAYPARAETMQWALENSPGDFSAYENQQFHTVTRFLTRALGVIATPPSRAPTQFIDGDAHAIVLRSDWTSNALQITGLTAVDPSADETFSSRHHMENPLDLVLHAAGTLLLPTASGGPTVTTSPNRAYYLLPSSKNIPLVDGNAPYVLEPLAVTLSDTIDSQDVASVTHRLVDAATTTVESFASGVDVSRTLALVGDSYGVVVDRFSSGAEHAYGVTWRGRGEATLRAMTAGHIAADYVWPTAVAPMAHLAVDSVSASPLDGDLEPGSYAPAFGVEEPLNPLAISGNGSDVTILSLLRPRAESTPASTFAAISLAAGAAGVVTSGAFIDTLIAGKEGTQRNAAGMASDARLALVRTLSGSITGIAGIRTTGVDPPGPSAISIDTPTTFAATLVTGTAVITIGAGASTPVTLTLTALPGLNPNVAHGATFEGTPLAAEKFIDGGTVLTITVPGAGVLVVSDL